jgi:DNA (cytosine-5)-methyltransferase 1
MKTMTALSYLSVCSGIEAATAAWHPLGWKPSAFAEIERFPSAVLAHHYPDVPNFGDMTRFKEWPDANVDVLVGGTPCQSFSVAGLRKGLADPRGNLCLTYLAIAQRYRPRWVLWENVPGVLSSDGGQDFAAFLGGLGILGYGWAYRVLDAQFFGLAQRRRRCSHTLDQAAAW